MGRVEYGATTMDDGGERPYIAMTIAGMEKPVVFYANHICDTKEAAEAFLSLVFSILSGRKDNLRVSPGGRDGEIVLPEE